jgi:hypothetical protein
MMSNHFHKAVKLFYSSAVFITGKKLRSCIGREHGIMLSVLCPKGRQNPHFTGYNDIDNSFAAMLYLHSEIDGEMVELV